MTDPSKTADSYICLSSPLENQYRVDLRYFQPDEQTEKDSTGDAASFDFDALIAASLRPDRYGALLRKAVFGDAGSPRSQYFARSFANPQGVGQELLLRLLIDSSPRKLHDLQ